MGTARRRSLIGRALLSLALWAGFWALALGLVAGLAAIPIAQAAYGDGPDGAGLLAGAGAAVVAWGLRPRWGQRPAEARPAPLGRDEFPALHALLADVARRSGAPVPAVVHLASRANAAIWVERRWLGLRRTWVVELGLPLVAALERDELAAVLAHELGHRVGGDLLLGAWVHRTRAAIGSTVDALDGSAFLLDAPFRAYGRLFLAASGAVSREQELAADAHAAALCGPRAAASALRKIEALAAPWDAYFDLDLVPLVEQGARLPLLEGFRRFLAAPARREEVDRALDAAARRPPAPWDSHPALEQRLLAMGAPPPLGAPRPSAAGGALALLGGEAAAEAAWYARATRGELHPTSWDAAGTEVVLPAIASDLEGTRLAGDGPPLEALPGLVRDAEELWRRSARGVNLLSPATRARQGRRLVAAWLTGALARRGFALEVRPGATRVLRRGGEAVEPAPLVEALAAGALSEADCLEACRRWEGPAAA